MQFQNLLVSGCSFTKDWGNGWASNIKESLDIPNLYDCAISGAGNTHIHHSIISRLELNLDLTPENTLVIVMWSGADRVDSLIGRDSLGEYWETYEHFPNVFTGLTGGAPGTKGNVQEDVLQRLHTIKSREALSLDTFINVISLHHYLESKGFKHFFLNWRDTRLPARDHAHDWMTDIPDSKISRLFLDIIDVYSFSLKNGLMQEDDYHPTSEGYKQWCSEVLLPKIQENL